MNLGKLFKIAKAIAPVVIPALTIVVPIVKATVKEAKAAAKR